MPKKAICLPLAATLALLSGVAQASSDDAWKEFAADVKQKCKDATKETVEYATAVVDPTGSEHFGLALVTGKPKGANGFVTHICVYDKQTKSVEIGSEMRTDKLNLMPDE